jgi:predicted dehydrogenase
MLAQHSPDVISICTPQHVRYELIRTIFEHASPKLLFIEKPVATSIEEALKIGALAARHHCSILVNHSRRWSEGAERIRQKIRANEYGRLTSIHLRYSRGIYNSGSHLFDLVRFMAGAISEVKVVEQVPTCLDDKQDWSYSFLFKMKDQWAGGYAQAFDDRNYNIFELELYFEKGKIEYLHAGDEIRFYSVREHPVQKGLNMLKQDEVLEGLAGKASSIALAVEHVKNIVESAAAPICTLEDGIYPLCVANALIESHRRSGSWETIEIPCL